MVGPFDEPEDATPLEPDEKEGLRPAWVTTRRDLNEVEQDNILKGSRWARRQRKLELISEAFMRELHRRMFGDVWTWAGMYRRTERNIGIDPVMIGVEVRKLIDDTSYWLEHEVYSADEIAVRFHHRAVWIHPFPNGNGRYSRLHADSIVGSLGCDPFSWGRESITRLGETRRRYVDALRRADAGDIAPLLEFARD